MALPPDGRSLGIRAVGFDPGLADTGFAVLAGAAPGVVLGTGVIHTAAEEALEARLERLFEGVHHLLQTHDPQLVLVEDVFSAPRVPRAAILMGYARAMICLAARQRKLGVVSVTPAEVKRAVTGSGVASKAQVARAVQALLRLPRPPRPSHVADALALAFTGLSRAGALGRR